jgi:hypothetical protein
VPVTEPAEVNSGVGLELALLVQATSNRKAAKRQPKRNIHVDYSASDPNVYG